MTFNEYYQYYLTLHQNKWCRLLHVAGQIATVAYIVYMISNSLWLGLLGAPFVVYPFAWSGHFFFEKNRPAAWSKPLWAKACDWLMLRDMLLRRL
tara:strand:+ start:1920 stop:2204 length:285 start_codon:yes stop_codon:yes gene_type:complete